MNIKENFERVGFTPEEKMNLTARLAQAVEQKETMTDTTKRKIKRISGGMIFGVAAAVMMTAGALAAAFSPGIVRNWLGVSTPSTIQTPDNSACQSQPDQSEAIQPPVIPEETTPPAEPVVKEPSEEIPEPMKTPSKLRDWFNISTVAAPEALEKNICPLNRSETYNGWTVTLDECAGDDSIVYVHVTVTAPEGAVLDESRFYGLGGLVTVGGGNMYHVPDKDPTDNRIAFLIQSDFIYENLQGKTVTVEVSDLLTYWWEREDAPPLSDEEKAIYGELTELAAPIRDHVWTFEDVVLDFTAQTVPMESGTEVPYWDGTTTVTKLVVSPFSAKIRVEGGSIAAYADYDDTFTFVPSVEHRESYQHERHAQREALEKALTVEVVLRDGNVIPLTTQSSGRLGRTEGIEGPSTPFVAFDLRCAEPQVWNPDQVDYVRVCGVDIPVESALTEN